MYRLGGRPIFESRFPDYCFIRNINICYSYYLRKRPFANNTYSFRDFNNSSFFKLGSIVAYKIYIPDLTI